MAPKKLQLNQLIVERGYADSIDQANRFIAAGLVSVDGNKADKAGMSYPAEATIEVRGSKQFVGRGALKLQHALRTFNISASQKICADVGSSTGGFTQVLLQADAKKVYAIDVGYGELDWKLRQDSRVVVMERTNARHISALPEPVSLVTMDVSFISVGVLFPVIVKWLTEEADLVVLLKPQFEAAREDVGPGGIITDPAVHRKVLDKGLSQALESGLVVAGIEASPIYGGEGNKEFLLWLSHGRDLTFDTEDAINQSLTSIPARS